MADRLEAVAIDGLGEIVPGDDLPSLIADAVAAAGDLMPLRDDDVLVVTQKVVSKAEGAIVDLTTIEPRPEVVEYAERFDRDPRQVELVLREAKRVVRMENGLVITETPHGFVCANGGIDASNVGPRSGDIVTLLPSPSTVEHFTSPEVAIAVSRIENHYMANHGWLEEGQLLRGAAEKLRGIPGVIVQGRHDSCTPPSAAWKLKQAWPEVELNIIPDAGHLFSEPGNLDALVRATDKFAGL